MAPLVLQVPFWAVVWCAVCWGYLLVRDRRGWPRPSRGVWHAIFFTALAIVLMAAGMRFDGGDFITLLVVMAGLKPLEVDNRRDCMVTLFLGYFLTITSLFVFENLSMTLYLFVSVWVTTGVLIHVNDPTGAIRRQMRLSARLMVTAIPLMAVLFLLFPRLSGSYWGSPWSRHNRSGFSSTMRIGDVSQLVLVDEPAFSVSFDTTIPRADQRYWRGIVFQRFDGRAWHPDRNQAIRRNNLSGDTLSRYTVVLEPHGHRHLFVLDLPVAVNPVATIMQDHTLVARRPIRQRFHYGAASFLSYHSSGNDTPGDDFLQLPTNRNPRALALGKQWRRELNSPERRVARALNFFRQKEFVYTLQPDRLGVDSIDDFLFVSRSGFCEHYAAAFAVLMRAAGVPCRIVGGYQGGKWNAVGEFLSVRHSDAHAWCEVRLAGRGWVRVDPTAVVAPERIESGIEGALSGQWLPEFLSRSRDAWLANWAGQIQLTWEAVNTRWNMWFMGFAIEDQLALFKHLGLSAGRRAGWVLLALTPPVFVIVVVLIGRLRARTSKQPPADESLIVWDRFLKKMMRIGIVKASHQGPLDFARSAADQYPALEQEVAEIVGRYIGLRYGQNNGNRDLDTFRHSVRRFKPHRLLALSGQRPER
jgi:transglutaminase-like putative cysteine protease